MMNEAREQLLKMLQDGKISADQAAELLSALESETTPQIADGTDYVDDVLEGEVITPGSSAPDMNRFRQFWQIPFFICLAFLAGSGLWLRSVYQSSEGAISFGFACLWSFFLLAFGLTVLAFMSRRSAWIHVRMRERKGARFSISLPLPLGLASWGLHLAEGIVPESERGKVQMAAQLIEAAREGLHHTEAEPILIDLNDNGDRVQIFIG